MKSTLIFLAGFITFPIVVVILHYLTPANAPTNDLRDDEARALQENQLGAGANSTPQT